MTDQLVVVVGSCMIDLVSYAPRLPRAGETLTGYKFQQGFGGKGANQCVAAAKLGAKTALIARLGNDSFGHEYQEALSKEGIDTQYVSVTHNTHTGMAQITVAENGENQIVIVPGANLELSPNDVLAAGSLIKAASVILFQLETPIDATIAALLLSKGKGKRVVNAAPAVTNPDPRLYSESDIFCVNETEAELMSGVPVTSVEDAKVAAKKFLEFGCKTVIITLGSQGAVFRSHSDSEAHHVPIKKVQALDTTGAGDAFIGAMAYYLAYHPDLSLKEVIHRSCNVASVSVQSAGTQTSFPSRDDLPESFFNTELY